MKLNQLTFPLVIALAATLASTGCKKGYHGLTPLPNNEPPIVNNPPPGDVLPPGNTMEQGPTSGIGTGPGAGTGPIATSSEWNPDDMIKDASALAAYTVHFKFDDATVQDSEQSNVSSVAAALTSDPNAKLLIEGNCDERGTEEYNRALGERRALALREALAKLNIDPERIRTISYGKDKPVDTGHDEAAFAKNRRGDFVLCHPK